MTFLLKNPHLLYPRQVNCSISKQTQTVNKHNVSRKWLLLISDTLEKEREKKTPKGNKFFR